ncbi:hypothetical protein ANN_21621 [Periplaneta americana]|uniref:Uncharacterized protein n=1 Tax=Periplaneta americana TaxID=6978 RepID=A0ABQ8S6D6_PERAM|nr:hypothetical protein ANN_21621 [Periplaneta americana]
MPARVMHAVHNGDKTSREAMCYDLLQAVEHVDLTNNICLVMRQSSMCDLANYHNRRIWDDEPPHEAF